jgi:hypothetical protein
MSNRRFLSFFGLSYRRDWAYRAFVEGPSPHQQEMDLMEWESREAWLIDDNFAKYLAVKL